LSVVEYVGSAFFKMPRTPSRDMPVTTSRKRSRASHNKSKSLVASRPLQNGSPHLISIKCINTDHEEVLAQKSCGVEFAQNDSRIFGNAIEIEPG
jgi:hypothetical protein